MSRLGSSFHETTFPAGLEFDMWSEHPVEPVYCDQGRGVLTNRDTGETFAVEPGTLYALDQHDRHTLRADETRKLVCAFDPPVSGREIHDDESACIIAEHEPE